MTRIVVAARCLNEEKMLPRFLAGYDWADAILLLDGGSADNTERIARRNPKVVFRCFESTVTLKDGSRMNPENEHAAELIQQAKDLLADWIVMDDVDCVPNFLLREVARRILRFTDLPEVHAYRLYLWMKNQYLPKMIVGQSLWAWRPDKITISTTLKMDPFDMEYKHSENWKSPRDNLGLPLCLLHDGWPNEKRLKEKMARYASWGRPQIHPLETYGPPETLPWYAHE